MREIRPSSSEGGAGLIPCSYPYPFLWPRESQGGIGGRDLPRRENNRATEYPPPAAPEQYPYDPNNELHCS